MPEILMKTTKTCNLG